jgi:hypothetical protein
MVARPTGREQNPPGHTPPAYAAAVIGYTTSRDAIRGRDHEREPVERYAGVLFYLDNQQLLVDEMVRRIARAEAEIIKAVTRGGPALYAIGADAIRRTWP